MFIYNIKYVYHQYDTAQRPCVTSEGFRWLLEDLGHMQMKAREWPFLTELQAALHGYVFCVSHINKGLISRDVGLSRK